MKLRQDFVTNSSSTSFGAASVIAGLVAALSSFGVAVSAAAEEEMESDTEKPDVSQEGPDRDFDPEGFVNSDIDYNEKLDRIDKEIDQYEKEWESIKDSLDKEDYDQVKKEYEEYIDYLKGTRAQAEGIEFEKQIEKIAQEAEKEYKDQWIDERKKDLENTREQIEFINASIKGYKEAGYDTKEAERQLDIYKEREKELDNTLKSEGIEHNYKAKERDDIGPSKSVAELVAKVDEQYNKILEDIKKEKIDRKKKEIIERNIEALRAESAEYMKFAGTADKYLKTAEAVQSAADIGVDALEKVTGPAGKVIKKAYVGGKGLGSGVGEAMADPSNAASHIIKGTVKGAGDLAKEFTDSQLIKDGINIASETVQGGIDSYQKGESLADGLMGGIKKAGIEIAGDRLADKFLPNTARDIDFGSYSGSEIYKGVVAGNPTIKEFIKDSVKDSLKNNTLGQVKNLPKGEGFIFGDLKIGD